MSNNAYNEPLDIANRALQHLKKPHIGSIFPPDSSPGAYELSFSYDKVRQGELRRNLWRFATRRCILRPLDKTTMKLVFPAWAAGAYLTGDVVTHAGQTWVATQDNPSVAPSNGAATGWDSYYGPVWAQQYLGQGTSTNTNNGGGLVFTSPGSVTPNNTPNNNPTAGYQAGEWVFIPYGNGQAAVYQCLAATTESPLQSQAWDATVIYQTGAIVSYPNAAVFTLGPTGSLLSSNDVLASPAVISLVNINIGNEPDLTNTGSPQPPWDATTTWVPTQYVVGSDNQVYLNVTTSVGDDGLTGADPVHDYDQTYWQPTSMFSNTWAPVTVPAALSPSWRYYATVALQPISLVWPTGAGPAEDTTSQNVYHVPANWFREAPEDPKGGLIPWLGGPTGKIQKDWVFEGDFIVTREALPILVRFVADVQNVALFDPMFCEALSLNMAIENAAAVDSDQGQVANSKYGILVQNARVVNAIEVGPVVPADCQLISVRY